MDGSLSENLLLATDVVRRHLFKRPPVDLLTRERVCRKWCLKKQTLAAIVDLVGRCRVDGGQRLKVTRWEGVGLS